uniref:uncharacterized protein DDB_G0288805-like n=1 Tax=Erigeron canadensis TaxID=72917 RepID=UPI001CB88C79|nr:uncharacterized protein DDB_G0288805-like [Erigeron canadensis]
MVTMNTNKNISITAADMNNSNNNNNVLNSSSSSDYEKCREERIKENLERMQKFGIFDLSLKLKSIKPNNANRKKNFNNNNNKPFLSNQNNNGSISSTPLPSSGPTRRSSRLQNTPAVSYTEAVVPKKGNEGYDILMMENSRPEVYTEEHEKLLGEAKMEWTLFVDGYGKDGKKIYDPVRGKTCHQCRQKTLGHRTHCIQCNLVQGQFCGDCLYMRYGENVLEAMQNPDWICPVCRGICNCSLCRQAKGWAPTGIMYRKISSLGYKSVAHYLIQTRRSDPNSEKKEESKTPVTAKRSLSFSSEEVESKDDVAKNENIEESKHKNPEAAVESEDGVVTDKAIKDEKPSEMQSDEPFCNNIKLVCDQESKNKNLGAGNDVCETENKNKVNESEVRVELTNVESKVNDTDDDANESENRSFGARIDVCETESKNMVNESKVHLELSNVESKVNGTDAEAKTIVVTLETKPGSRKKRGTTVPRENSIAGRLRNHRSDSRIDVCKTENKNMVNESEVHLELSNVEFKVNGTDDETKTIVVTPETKPGSRKKRGTTVPIENSIAGRLRSRRKCA